MLRASPIGRSRLSGQPCRMSEYPLNSDLRSVWKFILDIEPGKVLRDRVIQTQFALFPELHDRNARKEFGYGADTVDGIRVSRTHFGHIGEAEAAAPDQILIIDDTCRHAGDIFIRQLCVYPGFDHLERSGNSLVFPG